MKTFILILVCLLAGYVIAQRTERMQFLGEQGLGSSRLTFEFYRDTETGQEVICAYGKTGYAGCYLTGRKW
jgi:hypothetical protein